MADGSFGDGSRRGQEFARCGRRISMRVQRKLRVWRLQEGFEEVGVDEGVERVGKRRAGGAGLAPEEGGAPVAGGGGGHVHAGHGGGVMVGADGAVEHDGGGLAALVLGWAERASGLVIWAMLYWAERLGVGADGEAGAVAVDGDAIGGRLEVPAGLVGFCAMEAGGFEPNSTVHVSPAVRTLKAMWVESCWWWPRAAMGSSEAD